MKLKGMLALFIATTLLIAPTFAAVPKKADVDKYLAQKEIRKVLFDGERKTMSPKPIMNGSTPMVPMNWVSTQFGGKAVINPNKSVTLTLGSKTSTVPSSGTLSSIKIINNQVFVPANTVAAAYGYETEWSKYTKTLFFDRIITDYVAYYKEVAADPVKGTQLSTLSSHTIDANGKIHLAGRKDLTSWKPMVPDTAFLPNASEALIKMAPYQAWSSRGFVDFQRGGTATMINGAGFDPDDQAQLSIWLWNTNNPQFPGYITAYMTQNLFDTDMPEIAFGNVRLSLAPEYERAIKYATRAQFGIAKGKQIYDYVIANKVQFTLLGIPGWNNNDHHEKDALVGGFKIHMWNYGGSDLNFYILKK